MKYKLSAIFISIFLITITGANGLDLHIDNLSSDYYLLVRVSNIEFYDNLPNYVEIVGGSPGEWLDLIIHSSYVDEFLSNYEESTILIDNVDLYLQSISGEYPTFDVYENIIHEMANDYPDIVSLYSLGLSYEDRNIWCLEISDNPGIDEDEVGIYFMGLHHAREWPTLEICLFIAQQLASNYDSDPVITNIVNNQRIWIVPCVNPDGYYYSHDYGHDWRKNRHFFPDTLTYGVDLNRNYAGSSNGDILGSWGSIGRGSVEHNPRSEVYCGPGPLSELETKAISSIFLENDITAAITWHTHGELVMWPWGYSGDVQSPDDEYMSQVGIGIASQITTQDGSDSYTPIQAAGLYPTTGDTTDWAYGYYHYILGKPLFAYTIEACDSFHPSASNLDQITKENWDGAFYLLKEAENIKQSVIPRVVPPIIDDLGHLKFRDFVISWSEKNPGANPSKFQLDEFRSLSFIVDDAESGSDNWIFEGFEVTEDRYHSDSRSYKTKIESLSITSMTSMNAVPVSLGSTLSFWCWYDMENRYDYAFIEVSREGRLFEILDKFTGNSNGWIYKEYSLDDYTDESVIIRFRYSSDFGGNNEGFYVDDISTIIDVDEIATLSDNIKNNFYTVTNHQDGIFYYRVRGYNDEHGWGDFSTLKKVQIGNEQPNKPSRPTGPINGKMGIEYNYSTSSTDPQGNDLYYFFYWGDGTNSGWLGPYKSGEEVKASNIWQIKANYKIRVKAKDTNGHESEWSDPLTVSMAKTKFIQSIFFNKILEKLQITSLLKLLK